MRQSAALLLLLLGLLLVTQQPYLAAADDGDSSGDAEAAASSSSSEPAAAATEPAAEPAKKPAAVLGVDGDVSAALLGADGKRRAGKEGKLGEGALFKGTKLNAGDYVEVTFTPTLDGEAARPQQAMLRASSAADGSLAAYAVAKAPKKAGAHTAAIGTAAIEKQLGAVGGEFKLELLLGDPAAPKGLSAELGTLVLPEPAGGAAPAPKLLTAARQPVSNAKPNIAHLFRKPEKRAPAVVSLAFAGLAAAPLALLVVYLGAVGAINFKGWPSGVGGLWALLFHGGIAALMLLYAAFWLRLNLAQTLPLALAIGGFVAATGYKALSALSDERLAAAKAAAVGGVAKKTN